MVSVQIGLNDGYVFVFQDGDVNTVRTTITAAPEQMGIAASSPGNAILYDYEGVLKTVIVEGQLSTASTTRIYTTGGTPVGSTTSISDQKKYLEKQLSGNQVVREFISTYEDTSTFNGSTFGKTYCMIQSMDFAEEAGNPNELPFRMVLLVGG